MNKAELFIRHLDLVTGRKEDQIQKIESTHGSLPNVFVFVYKNWPEDGLITGFTFGLSAANHPDWKFGKPELMISVESDDDAWPLAIGYLAEKLRGDCPFCYGNTINFHAKVSEASDLDAFLIFAPTFLKKEQWKVELDGFTCNIAGIYPIYSSELPILNEVGIEKFWKHPAWDPFDVHRKPLE